MRRLSGRLAPLIVVLAGLAILLYPTVSNYLIERNASRVIQRYGEAVQAMSDEEAQAIMDAAHRYNTALAQRAGAIPSDGTDDLSAPSEDPSALLKDINIQPNVLFWITYIYSTPEHSISPPAA